MCEILEDQVNFSVKYGKIELKSFVLGKDLIKKFKKEKIFDMGSHFQFKIAENH